MSRRLFVVSLAALALALFACGGDGGKSDDDSGTPPEEAGAGDLTGLGQKCGGSLPACPANAPDCVGLTQNGGRYCTPHCLMGGSGMTNGQGALPLGTITPPPDTAICTGAFTGTVGTPSCGLILALAPPDNPLQPDKAYTGINLGCLISCGAGNTCPTGYTCMTPPGVMPTCFPNL